MTKINVLVIYAQQLLTKGWEVSILLLLSFLQIEKGFTLEQIGLLSTVFAIFQIILTLIAGKLIIHFNLKIVLVISVIMYFVAWYFLSIFNDFYSILIAYALAGCASGLYDPTSISFIIKSSGKGKRASSIATLGAFGDSGRIAISALTSILAISIGGAGISHIYAFIVATSLVPLILLFKIDSYQNLKIKEIVSEDSSTISYFKNKKYLLGLISGVLDSFASASLYIFVPLLLISKNIELGYSGLITSVFFIGYLAGRILMGNLSDKYGPVRVLIYAEIFMAAIILLLIFANNIILISTIMFLLGVVVRGTSPVVKAMAVDGLKENQNIEHGVALFQFSGRLGNAGSRAAFTAIGSIFGIPSIFFASAAIALATIIPVSFYDKVKTDSTYK